MYQLFYFFNKTLCQWFACSLYTDHSVFRPLLRLERPLIWTVLQSIMCITLIRFHLHSYSGSPQGLLFTVCQSERLKLSTVQLPDIIQRSNVKHRSLSCSSSLDSEGQGWSAPFRSLTTTQQFTHSPLLCIAHQLCGHSSNLPMRSNQRSGVSSTVEVSLNKASTCYLFSYLTLLGGHANTKTWCNTSLLTQPRIRNKWCL